MSTSKGGRRRTLTTAAALSIGSMLATMALGATAAGAQTITTTGSVSVVIPKTMPDDAVFTVTVDGQTYDMKEALNNTFGGTLTLAWAGSIEQPSTSVRGCPDGAPGAAILLEEATPSATLWASWLSPSDQALIGPIGAPARDGYVAASLCVYDDPHGGSGGGSTGGGDPTGQDPLPPCDGNNGNGNGNGSNGNGNGNGNNGNGTGNGNNGNGNGNGNGNAFGHQCH